MAGDVGGGVAEAGVCVEGDGVAAGVADLVVDAHRGWVDSLSVVRFRVAVVVGLRF